MKKRIINILLILGLAGSLLFTLNVRADSGWDSDYDFGGGGWASDWGGNDSWDYDWGHDSWDYDWGTSSGGHYSGGGSGTSNELEGFLYLCVAIFLVVYIMTAGVQRKNNGERTRGTIYTTTKPTDTLIQTPLVLDKVKEVIPSFDKDAFQEQAFEIYKNIQIAWMNFDYETLRKYTTDELYNTYHSELVALNLKKQKNIMSDFKLLSFVLIGMENSYKRVALKVRMEVELYDYVAKEDGEVVRGNKDTKLVYYYEMTFTCGLGDKPNKCPNCNAPLDVNQSSVCPYCDSVVISDNHDWVLSKKQMISQRRK